MLESIEIGDLRTFCFVLAYVLASTGTVQSLRAITDTPKTRVATY